MSAFLAKHWSRPLAPQGKAPENFGPQEASLAPADCGNCHAEQYRDWQTALHAQAMGPGLMGQLVNMAAEARAEHQDCIRCHAPLAEQADSLATAIAAAGQVNSGRREKNAAPPGLHQQGLICAACHLRAHERFGPPRRDGSVPDAAQRAALPHGGFTATDAFTDSRFCAACHQFEPGEFALNGKLLENTYDEWKTSRHSREGRSCQSCHMPERRHLWRGIHDPDMVRAAVHFAPEIDGVVDGRVKAALIVRNTGAGHYFPTYVTPKVVVEIEQIDAAGRALPKSRVARAIQRQVPLDLANEISDTRLSPDGEMRVEYREPVQRGMTALVFRLRVEPDEFYARFYRSLLAGDGAGRGRPMIREALRRAESSAFVAIEERRSLPQ
ncbi:MAG: hypothetical protein JNM32_11815 [Dechloromonas sp.]|nr:hypothetical protein [Dechloromonas sp.]